MSAFHSTTTQERTGKAFQFALFCAALAWSVSSSLLSKSSARGITNRFDADWASPLLGAIFLLFLLAVGYSLLEIIARRPGSARDALGLPSRPTATREWLIGTAIGWGMVALAVLPMALAGDLHVSFWFPPHALRTMVISLATIGALSLAEEVIFRGYPFRLLVEAIGPVAGTIGMSILFALVQALRNGAGRGAILIAVLSGVVFSISWLRTHGLWLAWGMRFAWIASMGVLFGLPVSSSIDHSTIVQTTAVGSEWLTGDVYGPEASLVMLIALVAGLTVLIRVTRDYAWNYTHAPIVAGGYPMVIAPPAAHTAMEQAAQAQAPALIQILPSTPQGRSVEGDTKL